MQMWKTLMRVGTLHTFRFIVTMLSFTGVVLLLYRDSVIGAVLSPLATITAQATLVLLQLLGIEAIQVASQIHHPGGFAYEVYYRCTGILPVAFLAVATLAYPATLSRKAVGLALGVPILISLNLMRLVHLYCVGVNSPTTFDFVHDHIWKWLLILATFGIWFGWMSWAKGGHFDASKKKPNR